MSHTKDIRIDDYDYPLPESRIARYPLPERDASKLLVYRHGEISQTQFSQLPSLLPEGALMVMNNTRVVQARLRFRKPTGGEIEVFVLEPLEPAEYQESFAAMGHVAWTCMVGGLKKWKEGDIELCLGEGPDAPRLLATKGEANGQGLRIDFRWDAPLTWAEVLAEVGELPIPPYLNRKTEESDKRTYQTVYSRVEGSVAAPTAGLHFTPRVLSEIDARGIEREEVTLHVGAGTFKPVKTDTIGAHEMHTEHVCIERRVIEKIRQRGSVVAVGTTSVRTVESLYYMGLNAQRLMQQGLDTGDADEISVGQWAPYDLNSTSDVSRALDALLSYMQAHNIEVLRSQTQIIIAPGYEYKIVRAIVTNFHQPRSTLLLLVSAFVGADWRKIYDYALANDFRFLSYGDSSILIP